MPGLRARMTPRPGGVILPGSAASCTTRIAARSVLDDADIEEGAELTVGPWDMAILEE
jgi:hypothetical protein